MGVGDGISDSRCYSFIKTSCQDLHHYFKSILDANQKETGIFEQGLNIDMTKYNALEKNGNIYAFRIMLDDHAIGYCILISTPFMHYSNVIQATVDSIFIFPTYRNLPLFKSVLNYIECVCKTHNIHHLFFASTSRKKLDALLKRCGFVEKEVVYHKGL